MKCIYIIAVFRNKGLLIVRTVTRLHVKVRGQTLTCLPRSSRTQALRRIHQRAGDWHLALSLICIYVSQHLSYAAIFIKSPNAAYVFWSLLTALIPTLFYFSIWELGIAGQELALLTTLSPVFLSITSLRNALATKGGLLILHVFSFSGLLAFALDSPLHRFFVVSFAIAVIMIRQVLDWTGLTGTSVTYQAMRECVSLIVRLNHQCSIVTGLGLVVSSLSKYYNHSNNPSKYMWHSYLPVLS